MIVLLLMIAAIGWHFSDAVLVPDHSDWTRSAQVEGLTLLVKFRPAAARVPIGRTACRGG